MDVSRVIRAATIALYLASLASLSVGQTTGSSYDPAGQKTASKRPGSLVDFTLRRMNPSDIDYGQCITEARSAVLDETVKSAYFWSNLIALGLLGGLFVVTLWQNRIRSNREHSIAEIVAQYEQALARSNLQIAETTKRNRRLADSLAALQSCKPQTQPVPTDTLDRLSYQPMRSHTAGNHGRTPRAPKAEEAKLAGEDSVPVVPNGPSRQIALFKPEVELVTKVNSLEQQLGQSHESEKQLRRQLHETARRLQAEQDKNRNHNPGEVVRTGK